MMSGEFASRCRSLERLEAYTATSASRLGVPAASVTTTIGAGGTPTFAVLAQRLDDGGVLPFDPARNRVFVRFRTPSRP